MNEFFNITDVGAARASFDLAGKRIYIAGHNGMVGRAIARRLTNEDCTILTVDHAGLDLRRQEAVERWVSAEKPDVIVIAAAKVGGIASNNSHPAQFIYRPFNSEVQRTDFWR
jgi:GDP-L-fucose synthase